MGQGCWQDQRHVNSREVAQPEKWLLVLEAFLRYIEPTKFYLLVDPRTMTAQQCQTAEANATLFNHWLVRNKTNAQGLTDYSIQSIKEPYKALRDAGMITFEVAPVVHKTSTLTDSYGRPIRDLRQERKDAARREAEEAAVPRRTMESEVKKATTWMETNRMIEDARTMIASYRAKYHSDTFRFREAAQKVLDAAIANDKTIGGIASAISEIKALSHKHYRE